MKNRSTPVSGAQAEDAALHPFRHSWRAYRDAGWPSPLPLPPLAKKWPPRGFTGRRGATPDSPRLAAWATADGPDVNARSNIGLRMPPTVLGIDMDQYLKGLVRRRGADFVAKLARKLGGLPPTWSSTRRDPGGPSRIKFFRVPPDVEFRGDLGDGSGVEIIWHGYRYAVVWPSVVHEHDDTRTGDLMQYAWFDPAGAIADRIPSPSELAELPPAWVEYLRAPEQADEPVGQRRECVEPDGTEAGLALLGRACEVIASTPEGDRNKTTNREMYHMARLVAGGELAEDYAKERLTDAALQSGLDPDEVERISDSAFTAAKAKPRQLAPARESAAPSGADSGKPYRIKLRDGAQLILDLIDAVNEGAVPDLYRSGGGLVHLFDVDDDPTMPVGQTRKGTREVTPTLLGALLARHVQVYETQTREGASGKEFEAEHRIQPELGTRQQVLAGGPWPGVPTLRGVTRIPVLRGDGTILNAPGYDSASGLYFDPQCDFSDLPTDPSLAQVAAARSFLLDALLRDFPFVSDADRANYLAALATPVVRRFLEGGGGVRPTPLLAVNAHAPGSGKTLLTEIIRRVFGGDLTQWKPDEAELGKCIVSALRDKQGAVYVLDNVEETQAVRSPTLSALLTSGVFTGRVLGQSRNLSLVNDLLWAVTGNNLRLEGDNASRSLLVGLDAGVERPDLRTGFKLGDLDTWLESSTNRGRVVRSLLVLARAWIVAGAPRIETPMRGFSWWASAMAGLLDFHGIGGFLGNTDRTGEADGARQEREAFLSAWFEQFGDRPMGVRELMGTYTSVGDQWGDAFILIDRSSNRELSTQVAGIRLRAMVDRPMGGLVLRSMKPGGPNSNTKKPKVYYVEPHKPGGRA